MLSFPSGIHLLCSLKKCCPPRARSLVHKRDRVLEDYSPVPQCGTLSESHQGACTFSTPCAVPSKIPRANNLSRRWFLGCIRAALQWPIMAEQLPNDALMTRARHAEMCTNIRGVVQGVRCIRLTDRRPSTQECSMF